MELPRSWSPFTVVPRGEHAPAPRSIHTPDGVCDRLRAAAFAEIQAREAFLWAAETFHDAPPALAAAWRALAAEEDKHLGWLLTRLAALGQTPGDRGVSDQLWVSLTACTSAREFALYMATAEDRGRRAGERFCEQLARQDAESARIFGQIAREEVEHIRLAETHFGFLPGQVEVRAQQNA